MTNFEGKSNHFRKAKKYMVCFLGAAGGFREARASARGGVVASRKGKSSCAEGVAIGEAALSFRSPTCPFRHFRPVCLAIT
jgi:hypothetical protein